MNVQERMAFDWSQRAVTLESAMAAIIDGYQGSVNDFYASGMKHWLDMRLALLQFADAEPGGQAIEVGCGVGRMTVHLAATFAHVWALDIAGAMIVKAPAVSNVNYIISDTLEIVPRPVDFVLSHLVFQHMPKREFWRYLDEAWLALRPGGIFCAQMHEGMQDWPDDNTLFVRGYTVAELNAGIDQARWQALAVLDEAGISEVWKWLILRKRADGS